MNADSGHAPQSVCVHLCVRLKLGQKWKQWDRNTAALAASRRECERERARERVRERESGRAPGEAESVGFSFLKRRVGVGDRGEEEEAKG